MDRYCRSGCIVFYYKVYEDFEVLVRLKGRARLDPIRRA